MTSTTQFISIVIILLALVTLLILTQAMRRRRTLPLRSIPAYERLPLMVGEAIEADRPVHLSFGHTGIGGENTVLTMAAAELFYQVAERSAISATAPILSMSDPVTVPVAQDTLRRGYNARGLIDRYRATSIRWYPAPSQPLAFAAATTATFFDDRVAASVSAGSFGAELALILEAAQRRDIATIATSDRLEGQAVAYAMADEPLIGEEVFTAGAYLGDRASFRAALVTQDVFRWLLVLAILLPAIDVLAGGALVRFVTQLIQGR